MILKISGFAASNNIKTSNYDNNQDKNITNKIKNSSSPSFGALPAEFIHEVCAFTAAIGIVTTIEKFAARTFENHRTKKHVQSVLLEGAHKEAFEKITKKVRDAITDLNSLAKTKKNKTFLKLSFHLAKVFEKKAGIKIKPHFNTNPHATTEEVIKTLNKIDSKLINLFLGENVHLEQEENLVVGAPLRKAVKKAADYLKTKYPPKIDPNAVKGKIHSMSEYKKKLKKSPPPSIEKIV